MGRIVDLVEAGPIYRTNERARLVVEGEIAADAAFSFFDRANDRFIAPSGPTSDPHYFTPIREDAPKGSARRGLLFGPEVTRHLRRDGVFTVTARGGASADILCKIRTFLEHRGSGGITLEGGTNLGTNAGTDGGGFGGGGAGDTITGGGSTGGGGGGDTITGGGSTGGGGAGDTITGGGSAGRRAPWVLVAGLILLAGLAAALYAGPEMRGPLCTADPTLAVCRPTATPQAPGPQPQRPPQPVQPRPEPAPDVTGLDAIAGRGRNRPCETLPDLQAWRARQRSTALDARAQTLERDLRAACEAKRSNEQFAQAAACRQASPCQTTCFDAFRQAFPGQRGGDIARLENEGSQACEARRQPPTPPAPAPAPQPTPLPVRSEAWARCEATMAPHWDPASPGGRRDTPRRPDVREAIGFCESALREASARERGTILFRMGRAQQIAGDRETGRQRLEEALALGAKAAAHALGNFYYNSQPRQHAEAARYFKIGADAGIAESKASLAGLLAADEAIPPDFAGAGRLSREAAEAGVGAGSRVHGKLMLDNRIRGTRDDACRWLRRAVEQGDREAGNLVAEKNCP